MKGARQATGRPQTMVASAYIWQEVRRVRQSEILGGQYLAAMSMPSAIVRVSSCSRNSSWLESTVRCSFQQAIRRSIDTGETLSRATGAYGTDKGATPASDWLAARTIDEDWDWMIPFRSDDTGDSRRPGPSKNKTPALS